MVVGGYHRNDTRQYLKRFLKFVKNTLQIIKYMLLLIHTKKVCKTNKSPKWRKVELLMENKKMTKKENFEMLATVLKTIEIEEGIKKELSEFIAHEIALLNRKRASSKNSKPSKSQIEIQELTELVYNVLADNAKPMRINDIKKANEKLVDLSTQRVSAFLSKLVKAERVTREKVKKETFFKLVDTVEESTEE